MTQLIYWSPQQIVASDKYPLTIGQIRYLLLHRHRNGLQDAVRKVGKRLMLRIDLFEQWLEQQKEGKNGLIATGGSLSYRKALSKMYAQVLMFRLP